MKAKTLVLTLALCAIGVATAFAAHEAHMGTWKLNEAKSKFVPGAAKNHTVVYEVVGDNTKVIVDGVDGDGKPVHSEWTGKFDGKAYPVTGDPTGDERSYTTVNARTLTFTSLKAGKATLTGRVVIAADGKTRTVTTTGTDAAGKKVTNVAVFDKA
jgi:hypothetical protein